MKIYKKTIKVKSPELIIFKTKVKLWKYIWSRNNKRVGRQEWLPSHTQQLKFLH